MSFGYGWKPFVSVAERRRRAESEMARQRKQGHAAAPVQLAGSKLATPFWGKAWNDNLESYSDYANRLPRGRAYVRNGSVVDLQITGGDVRAQVMGSELYTVNIHIAPLPRATWKAICADCAGSIDSLVALLQGRLSQAVAERVCRQQAGLFPSPREITLSCSCPDAARMCKHVAAVLYGIGARLDAQGALVFALRGVDEAELIAHAAAGGTLASAATEAPGADKMFADGDLSALFGLEIDATSSALPAGRATAAAQRAPANRAPVAEAPVTRAPAKMAATKKLAAKHAPVAGVGLRKVATEPSRVEPPAQPKPVKPLKPLKPTKGAAVRPK